MEIPTIIVSVTILAGGLLLGLLLVVRRKNLQNWLGAYLAGNLKRRSRIPRRGPAEVYFCVADHFEPKRNKPPLDVERNRVARWCEEYPVIARRHRDHAGAVPRYTFFYPAEEYSREHLDKLSGLCKDGFGDIEVHLHHDGDTSETLTAMLEDFKHTLFDEHGMLRKDDDGRIVYGFIHGNWALDNSRKDGRWCGVDDEIAVLSRTGCYADFTMPSAPHETQTRKINSIYYAIEDGHPNSHNTGIDVAAGGSRPPGDTLLCVQGPLALNFGNRKFGVLPRIENGELSASSPPSKQRIDLWIRQGIHVKGHPDKVFVKVYTHGALEKNMDMLLGGGLEHMFSRLEEGYNDGSRFRLFYVTAWDMYQKIIELEKSPV